MDAMDLKTFEEAYPPWLEKRRGDLEAADWKAAFSDYPFPVNVETPWTPLAKPLNGSRVMVLTTAGLYLKGKQPPFRAEDIEGDWTYRELPDAAGAEDLAIAHTHYPHDAANQDLNAVYPLDRLRELAAEGVIAGTASRHLSISGYCTRPDLLVRETIPDLLRSLETDPPDVVLHIPV